MSRKRVLAAATNGSRPGVKAVLSFRKADGNVPCDGFQKTTIHTAKTNMLFSILFCSMVWTSFPARYPNTSSYVFALKVMPKHPKTAINSGAIFF